MNLVPGHYGFAGPFGSITNAIRVRKFFSVSGKREAEGGSQVRESAAFLTVLCWRNTRAGVKLAKLGRRIGQDPQNMNSDFFIFYFFLRITFGQRDFLATQMLAVNRGEGSANEAASVSR